MQSEQRMRDCYAIVREHLRTAAKRRKDDYDTKVTSRTFKVGQWTWYYYPRRYIRRSPKWTKTYDGPFLVVGEIPPSDYIIQKTQKSAPMTVHKDKLKLCYGETPRSWLKNSEGQGQGTTQAENDPNRHLHNSQGHQRQTDQLPDSGDNILASQPVPPVRRRQTRRRSPAQLYGDLEDDLETLRTLPTRQRRLPQRFREYQM